MLIVDHPADLDAQVGRELVVLDFRRNGRIQANDQHQAVLTRERVKIRDPPIVTARADELRRVAVVGQTSRQGGFSQCMQPTGTKARRTSGYSPHS